MIVSTEAELMYPAISGLAGLGCGCGCNGKAGGCGDKASLKGIGDITSRSNWTLPLCAPWAWDWMQPYAPEFCRIPSKEEIIKDPSNYGPALTPENRQRAEDMTRQTIEDDDPCNYSMLRDSGMSELEKALRCGQVNWALWGLVALGGVILLKKI
jgi:hypothetical protein